MRRRPLIGGSLAAVAIAAAATVAIRPDLAQTGETPCYIGKTPGLTTTCGAYDVPEDYTKPDGRRIRLEYVRMVRTDAAKARTRSTSPVFFIDGGPGTGTVGPKDFLPSYWTSWVKSLATDRDVILFDQRGMGSSKPSLNCPELDDPVVRAGLSKDPKTFPPWASLSDAALKSCRARLIEDGVNLDQYNSANIIRDIDHLRQKLGHDKIIPFGVSNGTGIALKYTRDFESSVEAMVLDSVAPPDVVISQEYLFSFAEALSRIGLTCLAQTLCANAHADLESKLGRALERLKRTPVVVHIPNRAGGDRLYMQVDDTVFLEILFDIAYGSNAYRNIIQFVADTAQGRDDNLASYATRMVYEGIYSETLYEGAYWSINCSDEYDPSTTDAYIKRLAEHPLLRRWASDYWHRLPCSFWPMTLATKRERSPVESKVPALVLGDYFDPITPPSGAYHVAKGLPNAQVVVLPVGGHTVSFTNACAQVLVQQFLANPKRNVDRKCVDSVIPPTFEVSPVSMVGNSG